MIRNSDERSNFNHRPYTPTHPILRTTFKPLIFSIQSSSFLFIISVRNFILFHDSTSDNAANFTTSSSKKHSYSEIRSKTRNPRTRCFEQTFLVIIRSFATTCRRKHRYLPQHFNSPSILKSVS